MAETSAIAWTDSTVNFWWGCTKVSPACDHCYAEKLNDFRGNRMWGVGAPRRWIKGATALLMRMERTHENFEAEHGRRRRVFLHSMSDIFDNEVDPQWQKMAFAAIALALHMDIQLVTKRLSMVAKRVPDDWLLGKWPAHVGLIVTVSNQEEWDREIPRLISLKHRYGIPWVGVSIEPMLGLIDIRSAPVGSMLAADVIWLRQYESFDPRSLLDWIIVGGESGDDARPMEPAWARNVVMACLGAKLPVFFKQWGAWVPALRDGLGNLGLPAELNIELAKGTVWFHTCESSGEIMVKIGAPGKKYNKLDGETFEQFPRTSAPMTLNIGLGDGQ